MESVWYVTLMDRGSEITLEVTGRDEIAAKREAYELHPFGRVIRVESAPGRSV